jgi:uncharacterized protein
MTQQVELTPVGMVIFQPTTYCNLDCDYCYLPGRESKNQISLTIVQATIEKLFTSSLLKPHLTIAWHSGEPLAMPIGFYEDAFALIEDLKKQYTLTELTIVQSLQTNATLINQAWCDFFKKYDVQVGVSIDGPDFIHNAHRKTRKGLGSHAATMRGISWLQRNEINFNVIAVLTSISLNYVEEILDFFVTNNIKYIGFNIEELEGIHNVSSLKDAEMEDKYRHFMKYIYQYSRANPDLISIREFKQTEFFIKERKAIEVGQFSPFLYVSVGVNGDFSTFSPELLPMESELYGNFILGNFLKDNLESIVETEKFNSMYEDIAKGVDLCRNSCTYFAICGGGSPGNKYFENGLFASTETMYCRYTKKVLADIVLEELEKDLGLA